MKRCGKCEGINVPKHSNFCAHRWTTEEISNEMKKELAARLGDNNWGHTLNCLIETQASMMANMYRLMEQMVAQEIFVGGTLDKAALDNMRKQFQASIDSSPNSWQTPIWDTECQHDYATYHGFNESYQYCKLCDHKKEIPK